MTLNLSEREEAVLQELAERLDISKTGVMRQSLRLYQMIDNRLRKGETMAFVDAKGNIIKQEIFGCGH